MMKKLLTLLFLMIGFIGSAQVITKYKTPTEYQFLIVDSLGLPVDTFAVPSAYRNRPWLCSKNEVLYVWNTSLQKWTVAGGGSASYAPDDLEFVVGVTSGAPAAGTSTLTMSGSFGWKAVLYRDNLIQSRIDDGSGIYYDKPMASETLTLHGNTWQIGEYVRIRFYGSNGTVGMISSPGGGTSSGTNLLLNTGNTLLTNSGNTIIIN